MSLLKKYRFTKKTDFERLYKKGKTVRGTFFFIKYTLKKGLYPRVVIVIPKRIVKSAVDRNHLKRRCLESIRPLLSRNFKNDFGIVITKQPPDSFLKIQSELISIVHTLS